MCKKHEPEPSSLPEVQLKVFETEIDLYKFHLDLTIKVGTLMFAVTGAVVSYSLANFSSYQRWALLLPFVMNAGIAVLYFRSIKPARELDEHSRERLIDLRYESGFDLGALARVLNLFAWIYAVIAVGILGLFVGVGL